MLISWQWLNEMTPMSVGLEEAAEKLTLLGLEVDGIQTVCGTFSQVVVGQVLSVDAHPQADRLKVCQVDVGAAKALNIVCGAANVRANLKVACALVGAQVGDLNIAETELRGVQSQGMLCSEKELGMATVSSGIFVLPDDAPIGQAVYDYLKLDDKIINIDLTPNRGDCFSQLGVARELAAYYDQPLLSSPTIAESQHDQTHPPKISAPEACGRFLTCVLHNINPSAQSPFWMVEKLRRAGLRAIHPVVDVTNYVMLEGGQPLHAYDAKKISGHLGARWAKDQESLELLDGQTIHLDERTLVIADDEQALGLAGVMGGMSSAVSDATTDVILEVAWFTPLHLAGLARRYGLHTDASLRFERGVDFERQVEAMNRAVVLLQQICGAQAGPIAESKSEALPTQKPVTLTHEKLSAYLGQQIDMKAALNWFESSGFKIETRTKDWLVWGPTWRYDITIEEDLIEEVARFIGYDKLAQFRTSGQIRIEAHSEVQRSPDEVAQTLVNLGFQEVICYSFVDKKQQDQLYPDTPSIPLINPISQDLGVMRLSLLTGLLQTVQKNQNRQEEKIAIFEQGLTFNVTDKDQGFAGVAQTPTLGLALFGEKQPNHWQAKNQPVNFYTLKGVVEQLLAKTEHVVQWQSSGLPSWAHPGQSAIIEVNGEAKGIVAVLHPKIAQAFELTMPGVVAELALDALLSVPTPQWQPTSNMPKIKRDLSFLIDSAQSSTSIIDQIKAEQIEWLNDIVVYDLYSGSGIEPDKKSLCLRFIWQADLITPTDEQIDDKMNTIVRLLVDQFKIVLR